MKAQDRLFSELSIIHDAYRLDVRQFIEFLRKQHLGIVDGLKEYAAWLEQEHDGKRYSPATINRKIAAAKSRVRYAFKHSSAADSLRKKYQLEDVLKEVKTKRIDGFSIPAEKVLSLPEVKSIIRETNDATISLMVKFLVGTGVRISEMLGIRLSDLLPNGGNFVSVRIEGKGQKERFVHVKGSFIDRLRRYFEGTEFLFEHDGKPYNRISVTNRIKHEALKTIGREVTAHQLRHTWAVLQIQRGKSVGAVASALGHSDPGLTARMYSEKTLTPHEAFIDIPETAKKKERKTVK